MDIVAHALVTVLKNASGTDSLTVAAH